VPDPSIHVTLVFLGERHEDEVERIAHAVGRAAGAVDGVALGRDLRLPPRRPRVAAVALEDPRGRLDALQAGMVAALVALGVHEPERRRFLPHVTVARRARGPTGEVQPPRWAMGRFRIPGVTLYASTLSGAGARYEALARFHM